MASNENPPSKSNFTIRECIYLATCVNERKSILFGEATAIMKKEAWEAVTTDFNRGKKTPRTTEGLKKKWNNIVKNTKSKLDQSKAELEQYSELEKIVQEVNDFIDGAQGGVDSSTLQNLPEDNVSTTRMLQEESDRQADPTPTSPVCQTPSSNQQTIEGLTIQKLELEIEYYTLKIKSMKSKLEE